MNPGGVGLELEAHVAGPGLEAEQLHPLADQRGEIERTSRGRAVVELKGAIELGRLALTLAGGNEGVRRRVVDTITQSLRQHLA